MSGLPEIKSEYSPSYRRIYVAGVFGGVVPAGLEALFFSEEKVVDKVLQTEPLASNRLSIKRVAECELLLDPMQMKSVYKWLGDKIKDYETLFGTIPSPEEIGSRSKRLGKGSPSET